MSLAERVPHSTRKAGVGVGPYPGRTWRPVAWARARRCAIVTVVPGRRRRAVALVIALDQIWQVAVDVVGQEVPAGACYGASNSDRARQRIRLRDDGVAGPLAARPHSASTGPSSSSSDSATSFGMSSSSTAKRLPDKPDAAPAAAVWPLAVCPPFGQCRARILVIRLRRELLHVVVLSVVVLRVTRVGQPRPDQPKSLHQLAGATGEPVYVVALNDVMLESDSVWRQPVCEIPRREVEHAPVLQAAVSDTSVGDVAVLFLSLLGRLCCLPACDKT